MKNIFVFLFVSIAYLCMLSCNNNASTKKISSMDTLSNSESHIKKMPVTYAEGNLSLNGYIAFDSTGTSPRPVVLVIPEWWGVTDYIKSRADKLASLGYFAMVADMYGNGAIAEDPGTAQKMSDPFYKDFSLGKGRIDAALAKVKTYPEADTSKIAAIGYCFGGNQVLNEAKLGENFKAVVSFHGILLGAPAVKGLLKSPILICHGNDDQFVKPDEVAKFKKQLDSIGADYSFKAYPGATHAFTNPQATELGKKFNIPIAYNAAADSASWQEMKDFLLKYFK
ncbi:MAG: dienelactone hydrolase family protein [Bacteroidetes bacterium]|nr:dienelactone hydrolase family protein [Bacteroidota bacterium]MBS1757380.1 dienelactone hydrolase family protein [Bacteroidota bacterium]